MTDEMRLAVASLKDSHRQLLIHRMVFIKAAKNELMFKGDFWHLFLYALRAWKSLFKAVFIGEKKEDIFSETGIESESVRRTWEL